MGELKQKGNAAFIQSSGDDLTLRAWMDSKVVMRISNVHPPCLVTMVHHTKGQAVPWSGPYAQVQHVDGSYQRLRQIDVVSLHETGQFQV
eukprot:737713-Rhodomonas_salina.1